MKKVKSMRLKRTGRFAERATLGISVLCLLLSLVPDMAGQEQGSASPKKGSVITTFDVPGAGTGAGQGTIPEGINAAGVI